MDNIVEPENTLTSTYDTGRKKNSVIVRVTTFLK